MVGGKVEKDGRWINCDSGVRGYKVISMANMGMGCWVSRVLVMTVVVMTSMVIVKISATGMVLLTIMMRGRVAIVMVMMITSSR